MKIIAILLLVFVANSTLAQKDGAYLLESDPVCDWWELLEGGDAAPIAGMPQKYFIPVPNGSARSLMASKKVNGDEFECPTYFAVSSDEKFLYIEIIKACKSDLSEEEKYVKVGYNIGKVKSVHTISINGSTHEVEELTTILTLTVNGINYHYQSFKNTEH